MAFVVGCWDCKSTHGLLLSSSSCCCSPGVRPGSPGSAAAGPAHCAQAPPCAHAGSGRQTGPARHRRTIHVTGTQASLAPVTSNTRTQPFSKPHSCCFPTTTLRRSATHPQHTAHLQPLCLCCQALLLLLQLCGLPAGCVVLGLEGGLTLTQALVALIQLHVPGWVGGVDTW